MIIPIKVTVCNNSEKSTKFHLVCSLSVN